MMMGWGMEIGFYLCTSVAICLLLREKLLPLIYWLVYPGDFIISKNEIESMNIAVISPEFVWRILNLSDYECTIQQEEDKNEGEREVKVKEGEDGRISYNK
jgi:hypothetical protein